MEFFGLMFLLRLNKPPGSGWGRGKGHISHPVQVSGNVLRIDLCGVFEGLHALR